MPKGPIRRAQLVAPFGVGALSVVRDGTSVITCGIDHWYEREQGHDGAHTIDVNEFRVEEWRLQRKLDVDHFRLPPDFRIRRRNDETPNFFLTVPFLRFPRWHFCPWCNLLVALPFTVRTRERCPSCLDRKKRIVLLQVPFVSMCDRGHLQDFPWREWVHKTAHPTCQMNLKLVSTGGASLSAQRVECECGAKRTLAQITTADPSGQTTFLSSNLDDSGTPYLCRGSRPWLGLEGGEPCSSPIRGSLRSASNLYFADVQTALYLPRSSGSAPSELVDRLQEPPLSTLISLLKGSVKTVTPGMLRNQHTVLLRKYTDEQVAAAIGIVIGTDQTETAADGGVPGDDSETAFRRAEYRALRTARDEDQLLIRATEMSKYEKEVAVPFERIMLVHKLRETRVLVGFTRVFPNAAAAPQEKMRLLRRDPISESWLPAYLVFGEGLFFELREAMVSKWERLPEVVERVRGLDARYRNMQRTRRQPVEPIVPRFVLLHTLAHLLMNRLTFECGYSSAALRERLFVSANEQAPMAGVLIYTAAGDAEGTMGGLVRMGQPGYLEPMIRRALEAASWCSADPVCAEMGRRGGQGPDSCNLAACHGCALVPETACERFNRLLDRGCVVGDIDSPGLGFFTRRVV